MRTNVNAQDLFWLEVVARDVTEMGHSAKKARDDSTANRRWQQGAALRRILAQLRAQHAEKAPTTSSEG